MSFQNRLRIVLSESELSQAEIARRVDVGKSTITGWLNGDYEPNSENIYRVARLFNVTEAWLLGYTDIRTTKSDRKGVELSLENDGGKIVEVPSDLAHYAERLFALRMEDSSMNKLIAKDSIVVCVRPEGEVQDADVVVVKKNKKLFIRRVVLTEQLTLLEPVSYDTEHETTIHKSVDEINIVGVVKYSYMMF